MRVNLIDGGYVMIAEPSQGHYVKEITHGVDAHGDYWVVHWSDQPSETIRDRECAETVLRQAYALDHGRR